MSSFLTEKLFKVLKPPIGNKFDVDLAISLIERGADIHQRSGDYNRETVLYLAVDGCPNKDVIPLIQLLLKKGADISEPGNCYSFTPISMAMVWKRKEISACLLQDGRGELLWKTSLEKKDRRTALQLTENGYGSIDEFKKIFGYTNDEPSKLFQKMLPFWMDKSNYIDDSVKTYSLKKFYNSQMWLDETSERGYITEEGIFIGVTPRQLQLFVYTKDKYFKSLFSSNSDIFRYLKDKCLFRQVDDVDLSMDENGELYNHEYTKNGFYFASGNITCCDRAKLFKVDEKKGNLKFEQILVKCKNQNYCGDRYVIKSWKNVPENINSFKNGLQNFINTVKWCKCKKTYSIFYRNCYCDQYQNKSTSDVKLKLGKKEYPSHKSILSEKSEFLNSAFSGLLPSTKFDVNSNVYEIDYFVEEFECLLYFMYHGRFNSFRKPSDKVKDAALYYGINIDLQVD